MIELDLNTTKTKRSAASEAFASRVDAALEATVDRPRNYLGASAIGDECSRRVQYELLGAPKQPLSAKARRIFQRGHRLEGTVAEWLVDAGFKLQTVKESDGYPFGFSVAKGRFRGHVDGVITDGPADLGLIYPCIWENKILGTKGWKNLEKNGLAKAYPKYADQIAIYQTYLDLTAPALLTAVNADDMMIWYEAIPFDHPRAQAVSDRAVKILQHADSGEMLPRIASEPDAFPCSFCDFRKHCWEARR